MSDEQLSDDALIAKALLIDEVGYNLVTKIYNEAVGPHATQEHRRYAVLTALHIIQYFNERHGLAE